MAKERLLTVEEVAEQLSVGVETVRRWIRSGEMDAIDLGGRAGYRIRESALEKFVREREKKSDSDPN